ncbi:uncharacterized protein LOC129305419 [Prosopis cineraria]|uniref:uncharacterized protein LOC129305419 n=1 Tax=Prosopis cineraria TaxID=364024 RepID=UPI0024104738|nr:uncharacterized protein LOC129305419 [Prosopis cineraria]
MASQKSIDPSGPSNTDPSIDINDQQIQQEANQIMRGLTLMSEVNKKRGTGQKYELQWNYKGQLIKTNRNKFISYIGVVLKANVPITIKSWNDVEIEKSGLADDGDVLDKALGNPEHFGQGKNICELLAHSLNRHVVAIGRVFNIPGDTLHNMPFLTSYVRVAIDVPKDLNYLLLIPTEDAGIVGEAMGEAKYQYLNLCVPLYKYALEGNWAAAEPILLSYNGMLLKAAIAKQHLTVLHVATGAGHVNFVKKLVNLMHENDLALQDYNGNTAFTIAASMGNLDIVEIMLRKYPFLPRIRDGNGLTPLHSAALQGRNKMTLFLYDKTIAVFEEEDWKKLFLTLINTGIYDVALKMLNDMETLALAENENGETGLHVLAKKPLNLSYRNQEYQNQLMRSGLKQTLILELVRRLWQGIYELTKSVIEVRKIINYPSQLLFDATVIGNYDFIAELISSYPDLIWELDDRYRSIIHIAVLHRHAAIFNLIHDIGSNKDLIVTFIDESDGNNLLHMAAKLGPRHQLELVSSGATFQMRHELLWFKEVKKVMLPGYINKKNFDGITPSELFTMEHAGLRKEAECWMKGTAKSCMLVSTVITTGVFSAAINLPGGNNDDTGTPNYLNTLAFLIFAISDAIALISSSISILAFLSILVSRYAERDFYKSLPSKLILGLVSLFISITSMMITFSSSFFITYYHGTKWVPCFILVLSFLPTLIFVGLQYQLLSDIIYSMYHLRVVFQRTRHMLC